VNDEALDTCVRGLRNEMTDFTSDLVGIASENPPGNAYRECVSAIESRLRLLEAERRALLADFDEARSDGVKLDVEVLQEGRPSGTSEATPLGRALSRHVGAVTGKRPRFEMCPGLLEIRFYAERGMPAYAYGPGLLSISHGPKEFVDTDRIVDCAAIYARVAAEVLNRS
jgi:succinyl-diaminopimelate desuccinylase